MGTPSTYQTKLATTRHGGRANYLFADGHVESLKFEQTIGDSTVSQNNHFVSEWLSGYVTVSSHD